MTDDLLTRLRKQIIPVYTDGICALPRDLMETLIAERVECAVALADCSPPNPLKLASDLNPQYLIWSNEHRAWWRPEKCGYTTHLAMAGRYSHDVAMKICRAARGGWMPGEPPPEIPIAEADAIDCEQWAIRAWQPK